VRNKTPLRGICHPAKQVLRGPRPCSRRQNEIYFVGLRFPGSKNLKPGPGESGFTITELLIVIILTTIFTLIIMLFAFDLWRNSATQEANIDTLLTRFNASDTLREEIGSSSGLIIQNNITDSHTLVPDPSIPGNSYWLPIHAVPGNTAVGSANTYTPLIYFRRYSLNTAGQFIMNGTQPYEDEYVLYLDGSAKALKQRNLANPSASGDKLKTSCPPPYVSATCPADKVIASNITSVSTRYFSRTGNLINHNSITDPGTGEFIGPDFTAVEVLEVTLNLSKQVSFSSTKATQNSVVIRIALRNS
jgi:type II secretory pathway pseudopilin PulG